MRLVSAAQLSRLLARWVDSAPRIVAAGNFATPWHLLQLVDGSLPTYRLFMLNAQVGIPDRPGVLLETPFVGPGMRGRAELSYLPSRLSLVPGLFVESHPPDMVLLHTSPVRNGRLSMGIEVNLLPAALAAVRARGGLVAAQVNRAMPFTYGDSELDPDLVDVAIEVDSPLPSPSSRPLSELAAAIGDRVKARVADGATVQLGIGGIPDATLARLTDRRGLRVWSELVGDGVMDLARSGALEAETPVVASFLIGSPELYAWADGNTRLRMLRTETTNDPPRIAGQRLMTSINSALEVDLYAQANASRVGGRIHSGFGGQTDFVVGALHSAGGQALIALPSWYAKGDKSTVVPTLDGPVTSFQHSWIISEHGSAPIWPRPESEQAQSLINQVADPRARDFLLEAAIHLGLFGQSRT